MNLATKEKQNIAVPKELFNSMLEAHKKWAEFADKFEDFIMASDKKFILKMRRARKDHLRGKTRDIRFLRKELNV